ncbi:hypothetical protein V8H18_13205 [Lautropia mirabilis]
MIRYWVEADTPLPAADRDVPGHPGLIALGADPGPDRLVEAYTQGLFPRYSAGQPVLWWSPDPRMVVFVDEFSPSRSLRRLLARPAASGHPGPASPVSPSASQGAPTQAPPAAPRWQITLDTAFADVMQACAEPRPGQDGTGSPPPSRLPTRPCTSGAWPIPRRSVKTASSSPASMASPSAACSSASPCSPAGPTPPSAPSPH